MVMSCLMWILGMELRSCKRAASVVYCYAISSSLDSFLEILFFFFSCSVIDRSMEGAVVFLCSLSESLMPGSTVVRFR